MSFETALYQWQQGERRLQRSPNERTPLLERVTDALVADLRRRLGGRFSAQELVELYDTGTAWCLQAAAMLACPAVFKMPMARLRRAAMAWGPLPVRIWEASSP